MYIITTQGTVKFTPKTTSSSDVVCVMSKTLLIINNKILESSLAEQTRRKNKTLLNFFQWASKISIQQNEHTLFYWENIQNAEFVQLLLYVQELVTSVKQPTDPILYFMDVHDTTILEAGFISLLKTFHITRIKNDNNHTEFRWEPKFVIEHATRNSVFTTSSKKKSPTMSEYIPPEHDTVTGIEMCGEKCSARKPTYPTALNIFNGCPTSLYIRIKNGEFLHLVSQCSAIEPLFKFKTTDVDVRYHPTGNIYVIEQALSVVEKVFVDIDALPKNQSIYVFSFDVLQKYFTKNIPAWLKDKLCYPVYIDNSKVCYLQKFVNN